MSSGGGARGLLVLALLALSGCAHGPLSRPASARGEVVEAEGWTPLDPRNPVETRLRALSEAQKKAVEKVMGVTLTASTKVEQAVTFEQRILANIGGYIRRFDILSEREEGGFLKMRIRALVLYEAPPPSPRPAGSVKAAVSGTPEGLSAAVRSGLASGGVAVIEGREGAHWLVDVQARAYPVENPVLAGFHSFRARVALRALKPETGELLQQTQEASAIDAVAELAEEKAVETAGRMAGESLAARLSGAAQSPPSPPSPSRR